jgi:hypothetical protein
MDDPEHSKGLARMRRRAWIVSALISLACLIALFGMWVRAYTAPPAPYPADTVLTTPNDAPRFVAAFRSGAERGGEPPIAIPTGLYIQSVQFKGPYNVAVSGYMWQRYANDLPQNLDKGVVLPEADYYRAEEVHRAQQGSEELIGWAFRATLREQFDYERYPLDRQQIWLQLWHKDFDRNVYLVPDYKSYASLDPATLPALDKDVVLEHWDIQQSFFSYRAARYDASFGVQGHAAGQSKPELYYSILTKRHLLSILISRMIVPLVILIQLFVIVMVIGTKKERLEDFGVRPGGVIFTCAAFFFAVLVAHNALRQDVSAQGLVYLESLYILTYFVILAVALNSVLLVAHPNRKLFRDYDNLWAKVAYWPTILFALVLITFLALR